MVDAVENKDPDAAEVETVAEAVVVGAEEGSCVALLGAT